VNSLLKDKSYLTRTADVASFLKFKDQKIAS